MINPVVHLELHTGDLPGACAFFAFWQPKGPPSPACVAPRDLV